MLYNETEIKNAISKEDDYIHSNAGSNKVFGSEATDDSNPVTEPAEPDETDSFTYTDAAGNNIIFTPLTDDLVEPEDFVFEPEASATVETEETLDYFVINELPEELAGLIKPEDFGFEPEAPATIEPKESPALSDETDRPDNTETNIIDDFDLGDFDFDLGESDFDFTPTPNTYIIDDFDLTAIFDNTETNAIEIFDVTASDYGNTEFTLVVGGVIDLTAADFDVA